MEVLRVCFEAPTAHFSIPYALSLKKTYPIPPYSTVIGLLCNLLSDEEKIERFISSPLAMAVVGSYESIEYEYTWMRSFAKKFVSPRSSYGEIEHPGGQIPMRVQTLINSRFCAYINSEMMDDLVKALEEMNPLHHLHAGRAEDLISSVNWRIVDLKKEKIFETKGFTWIPAPNYVFGDLERYEDFFEKVMGLADKINTVYMVKNGARIFRKIPVKLYEGAIPMLSPFQAFRAYSDDDTPVFLAKVVET